MSHDAVTRETVKTGLELAQHRGLLEAETNEGFSRAELLESTRSFLRRIEMVARLTARRHADPFN